MDELTVVILSVMGVLLLVFFCLSWIAVRSARAERQQRAARPYTHRHKSPE